MDQENLLGFGPSKRSSQRLGQAERKGRPQHNYFRE